MKTIIIIVLLAVIGGMVWHGPTALPTHAAAAHVYELHVVNIPLVDYPSTGITTVLHRYTRVDLTTGQVCSMGTSFYWDNGEYVDDCWHQDGHKNIFEKMAEENAKTQK